MLHVHVHVCPMHCTCAACNTRHACTHTHSMHTHSTTAHAHTHAHTHALHAYALHAYAHTHALHTHAHTCTCMRYIRIRTACMAYMHSAHAHSAHMVTIYLCVYVYLLLSLTIYCYYMHYLNVGISSYLRGISAVYAGYFLTYILEYLQEYSPTVGGYLLGILGESPTYYLGLGPGFSPPFPDMRLSFFVPVLGLFFEGAFPRPSAMGIGPLSELLPIDASHNAGRMRVSKNYSASTASRLTGARVRGRGSDPGARTWRAASAAAATCGRSVFSELRE